jgi:hypothetical protein
MVGVIGKIAHAVKISGPRPLARAPLNLQSSKSVEEKVIIVENRIFTTRKYPERAFDLPVASCLGAVFIFMSWITDRILIRMAGNHRSGRDEHGGRRQGIEYNFPIEPRIYKLSLFHQSMISS